MKFRGISEQFMQEFIKSKLTSGELSDIVFNMKANEDDKMIDSNGKLVDLGYITETIIWDLIKAGSTFDIAFLVQLDNRGIAITDRDLILEAIKATALSSVEIDELIHFWLHCSKKIVSNQLFGSLVRRYVTDISHDTLAESIHRTMQLNLKRTSYSLLEKLFNYDEAGELIDKYHLFGHPILMQFAADHAITFNVNEEIVDVVEDQHNQSEAKVLV